MISFVRSSAWDRAFGMAGGGSFDCTDCDFVVVFAMHGAPYSVTTDTLNGVDGTYITTSALSPEDHYTYNSGHYWLTPGSGTKTLVITWSGNGTNRTVALGYRGVKQVPIVQFEKTTAWGNSISDIIYSTKPGNLVIDGVACSHGTPYTGRSVGALQTARSNTAWTSDGGKLRESCSDEPADGDRTMSWTASGSPKMAQISIEIEAAAVETQGVWLMSVSGWMERFKENRKKLGISDLSNFGMSNGLWKPEQSLVTI